MHPAILGIAIGTQLLTPVSDQVPKLDVETTCKFTVQTDKSMGLDLPQSFQKCMDDEKSAEQQLGPIWSLYSASVQKSCYDGGRGGGNFELCRSARLSADE